VPGYDSIYNLEISTFPNSTGGGRGGYSYAALSLDPTMQGPDSCSWGGNGRRQVGGLGGRPLSGSQQYLFFGGGGGAGHQNVNGGSGSAGGGLVFIVAGQILTTGSITTNPSISANGLAGEDSTALTEPGGGGGGGGSIYLQGFASPNTGDFDSIILVSATGGNGGNVVGSASSETHGGGGSGGGGAVYTNFPGINANVKGGAAGEVINMPTFPPNGATHGCDGIQSNITSVAPSPSTSPSNSFTTSATPTISVSQSQSETPVTTLSASISASVSTSARLSASPSESVSSVTGSDAASISASASTINPVSNTASSSPTASNEPLPNVVQCTSSDNCINTVVDYLESKDVTVCTDVKKSCASDTVCFDRSKAGATSRCRAAAYYLIKLTRSSSKEDQDLTIWSTKVSAVVVILFGGSYDYNDIRVSH